MKGDEGPGTPDSGFFTYDFLNLIGLLKYEHFFNSEDYFEICFGSVPGFAENQFS